MVRILTIIAYNSVHIGIIRESNLENKIDFNLFKGVFCDLYLIVPLNQSLSILHRRLRQPVVLPVSQVSLVFQAIPEEMARLGHVVRLARKESLGTEEMIT